MLAEKRGQTELSFGMIFSIILIVIFLVVGFYAVRAFIGIGQQTETAKFYDDLQDDINKAWKSSKVSEQQEYLLPGKIKKVCFVDFAASAEGRNQQIYEDLNFGTDSLSHNILTRYYEIMSQFQNLNSHKSAGFFLLLKLQSQQNTLFLFFQEANIPAVQIL